MRGGKGRMPDASCESGQALEKAQNGNGQLLEKVGMDLGLAPRPLGFGAASVSGWRRAGLGSTVNATRAIEIDRVPRLGQAPLVFIARRLRFTRNSSPDKSAGLPPSAQARASRGGLTRRQSGGRRHALRQSLRETRTG